MDRGDRRQRLLSGLSAGVDSVEALAGQLGVSPSTVRRELAHLEHDGLIRRTYGGAVLAGGIGEPTRSAKEQALLPEKHAIAGRAAALVPDGATVLLGAGSTSGQLARHLRDRRDLTVVTNGVATIATLAGADGVRLVVLGGRVRHTSQAILGPTAEEQLRRMTFELAFIGADGIDPDDGISCPSADVASIKVHKMRRARRVVVLADHRKLGARPYDDWAPFEREVIVLTDAGADAGQLAALRRVPTITIDVVRPVRLADAPP